MESGINNLNTLLTISIPTWNRASILDKGLALLLPQIRAFSQFIEVIISDNASDDNTQSVVATKLDEYPDLRIIYNRNSENIKFFGNFKKCKELAQGKYLWILSDDDYVKEHIVETIMQQLQTKNDYALIYLKNDFSLPKLQLNKICKEAFFAKETYRVGWISADIFLNDHKHDSQVFETYKDSGFIGFICLLDAFHNSDNVLIICGNCLDGSQDKSKGFNYFDTFVNHMNHVIDYMPSVNLSKRLICHFKRVYLTEFILPKYLVYKAKNKLPFGNFELEPIKEVESWIKKNYSDTYTYWILFVPFMIMPASYLSLALKFKRAIHRKINPEI
ncbi:MAG: glycosyltransferase family A protein [Bacteroidota bacterium]|nr:glycosyltransferase family A protein [Bacteroidota bacterium]